MRRWHESEQRGDPDAAQPNLRNARLRLTTFDGRVESEPIEIPSCQWPMADRLPNGQWLVVTGRAAPGESNAQLYSPAGVPAGTFSAGDGIEHVQCAVGGTVWVGYFDEGVFCSPNSDGTWPVSSSGIARFAPDGEVLWRFNDQAHDGVTIADCYALTLDGPVLRSCPYTDFPVVRIERDVVKSWRNIVAGAAALAIDADHVLLAGGYGGQSERIALLHLGNDHARQIGQWKFQRPAKGAASLLQGRGDTLHIVERGNWTRINLAQLRVDCGLDKPESHGPAIGWPGLFRCLRGKRP